jgi:histidinol-phosphatase
MASAPALGRRWWAVRGDGAFVDGAPCAVSRVDRIEDAAVSTTSQRRMPPGWRTIVQRAWANRGFGDFWHHCLVAQGSLDIATDGPYMRIWDYSAVQLIVEEAGGTCTTLANDPPSDGDSLISTNGLLHAEAIELLAQP